MKKRRKGGKEAKEEKREGGNDRKAGRKRGQNNRMTDSVNEIPVVLQEVGEGESRNENNVHEN